MPKPLERYLQASILRHLRLLRAHDKGFVYRKRHGSVMGTVGDPDIYGLYHGLHFEIELKIPGEEPTALQRARLFEWGSAGATWDVVRSVENLDNLIKRLARTT